MSNLNPTMSREFLRDLMELPGPVKQKALRTVDLMVDNPFHPKLRWEKVHHAEPGVNSCRVDRSYRIIWKHIKPSELVLCLVDKHDEAYRRAQRKSFALADGIVRIADILQVGATPLAAEPPLFGMPGLGDQGPGKLFLGYRDDELLEIGVPVEALPHIRALEDVNQLESVERLLPMDVYDRLLGIALGIVERPRVPDVELRRSLEQHQGGEDLYRFIDEEEFKRALAGSMEDWMLFLAPHQRRLVTRDYNGPARLKGVVGSGKTVVAVHRVRRLARQALESGGKVLFLTFGNRLPGIMLHLLEHLAGEGAPELEAIECCTVHRFCARFLRSQGLRPEVDQEENKLALQKAVDETEPKYPGLSIWSRPLSFFHSEVQYAIKGRCVESLDDYLALSRSGRGTPLRERQRRAVYDVYSAYQSELVERRLWDFDDFVLETLRRYRPELAPCRYVAAVVDEIQDLTEAIVRLVRTIVPPGSNDLFLVGDGLQRIYPGGYSLAQLGIDIVGRATLLRKNYRNTQEILSAAHAMMANRRFDDLDETDIEVSEPEYSVRHGEIPELCSFDDAVAEMKWVAAEIARLKRQHQYKDRDFALLKRQHQYKDRDFALLYRFRRPYVKLIEQESAGHFEVAALSQEEESYFGPGVKHTTFHSAKGLEFKVVFVLGVTDGRSMPYDDEAMEVEEREAQAERERRLLYVAMTRARDLCYLTCSGGPPSRFLDDVPPSHLRRC